MIHIEPEYRRVFEGLSFDELMAVEGPVAKQAHNRRTVRFERDGRAFYIKTHAPIGWLEVLKNLASLRLPVFGAHNEWLALERMRTLGIPAPIPVAYGIQGRLAMQRSFVVTEEIGPASSLAELTERWADSPPSDDDRSTLIRRLGELARKLHDGGCNHRDFYLCHFLIDVGDAPLGERGLYLIDLHRMQQRDRTPRRWIVKDLGGLLFSAAHVEPTAADLETFASAYGVETSDSLCEEVRARADRLLAKHATR